MDRVAEDDRLVDRQLGEERVEAVDLLPLLHKGVELGDAAEGQLLHEVDDVRLLEVPVLEGLDRDREGRGVEADLWRGVGGSLGRAGVRALVFRV